MTDKVKSKKQRNANMNEALRKSKKSKRKQAKDAFRTSEEEKTLILNTASDLIVYHSPDMRIIWANQTAADSVGKTQESLKGRYCYEVWHQRTETCIGCPVVLARDTGQEHQAEIASPDGRQWWIRGYPTKNANGEVVALVEVCLDITERKRAEMQLRASEERYRALYEDNPSMYFTVDSEGVVLSVNEFGAQQLGYTVEELVGKSVLNVFYPEDKAAVSKHMAECLKEPRKVFTWELRKVRKDGSILWVRETVRALQWIDGRMMVFVVCEDISKLKEADDALRESEKKYKSLTEHSPTGIYIHQDGKYVFVNKQFAEMHGYEPEELIGKEYLSLIYKGDKKIARNRVKKRLAGEDISDRHEVRRISKDGKLLWTEAMATVIQYKGRPAIMGNVIDISQRKQSEKEVQKRIKELEEFYDMAVGRELKNIELKKEIKKLKEELEEYKKS